MKMNFKWFLATLMIPLSLHAETVDKVVAIVNNETITQYQVDQLSKTVAAKSAKSDAPKPSSDAALQQLIESKLIDQEIKKRNITVSDQDVQKALQSILDRNNINEAGLKKEIESKGMSYEAYKKDVGNQLKKMKLMGQTVAQKTKVTDADLDEFFAQNPEKFSNYQSVEMAQIILALDPQAASADVERVKKQADEIIVRARKGDSFEELAKKYSTLPESGVKAVYQIGQLAPQLVSVIADLKPGAVSDPVRSNLGLHIVKLYERKTLAGEEFKAIRDQIRERVYELKLEESMQKYLDELKDKSYIKIVS